MLKSNRVWEQELVLWEDRLRAVDAMRQLCDDWDGQAAQAPGEAVVSLTLATLQELITNLYPAPTIVSAGVNGTIVCEWNMAESTIELEIETDLRRECIIINKLSNTVTQLPMETLLRGEFDYD
ncbi:MAG: hypothetical protein SFX18_03360 [Pirellulales bacterium]|nr:hypothetical protein [Pirellulales bacterium]